MRRLFLPLALVVAAFVRVGPVAAQATPPDSGFRLRVGGDVAVLADEREGAVVVVRGNASVLGDVGTLVVLDGNATVDGGRVGDLIVVRGLADLRRGAVVSGDVHLLDAKLVQTADSRVAGTVARDFGTRVARELFTGLALIGLGLLAALVGAGVIGSLVAPEGLIATARLIRSESWQVLSMTLVIWLAAPIVAILLIPTLVGLPIGLGYLVFVLPVLGFLGLIVAGAWLGEVLVTATRRRTNASAPNPVVATTVGILTLVITGRIPVVGLLATVLTLCGTGAFALVWVRAIRRTVRGQSLTQPPPPFPSPPAG